MLPRDSRPSPTPSLPSLGDLGIRVLVCDLLQSFFSFPFLSEACLRFCSTRRLERAVWLPLETLFPLPHDISGLYCNFPHGCPDTDSCVYENPLDTGLEPPWHSRFLLRLQCVLLRGAADKGRLEGSLVVVGWGEEQEHLYLHHALLQEASEAYDQGFLDSGGHWGGVRWRGEKLIFLERGLPGGRRPWFG